MYYCSSNSYRLSTSRATYDKDRYLPTYTYIYEPNLTATIRGSRNMGSSFFECRWPLFGGTGRQASARISSCCMYVYFKIQNFPSRQSQTFKGLPWIPACSVDEEGGVSIVSLSFRAKASPISSSTATD